MTTSLICQWSIANTGTYTLTAELSSDSDLPKNIFLYKNNGTAQLTEYVGVVGSRDLAKVPVWNGNAIDRFGVPYVRHSLVKIEGIPISQDIEKIATAIGAAVQIFSTSLKSISTGSMSIEIK